MTEEKERTMKPPSFLDALIQIVVLVLLLASAIVLYGDEGTGAPIQVVLMMSMLVAGFVGLKNGYRWEDMGKVAVGSIRAARMSCCRSAQEPLTVSEHTRDSRNNCISYKSG